MAGPDFPYLKKKVHWSPLTNRQSHALPCHLRQCNRQYITICCLISCLIVIHYFIICERKYYELLGNNNSYHGEKMIL